MKNFQKHSVLIFTFILLLTLLFASFYPSKEGMFWSRYQPQSVESGNAYAELVAKKNAYKLQQQQIEMEEDAKIREAKIAARKRKRDYKNANKGNVTTARNTYASSVRTDRVKSWSDNTADWLSNLFS
jgi:hypothetical protein